MSADDVQVAERLHSYALLDKAAVAEHLMRHMARSDSMPADDAKAAERLQSCILLDIAAVAERLLQRMARSNIMAADDAKATERLQSCAWLNTAASAVLCSVRGAITSADDVHFSKLPSVCILRIAYCSSRRALTEAHGSKRHHVGG